MELHKSYVYEGQEVQWTGRVATKNQSSAIIRQNSASSAESANTKSTSRRVSEIMLVEVSPVEGGGWKKWVREADLYSILVNSK